MSIEDDIIIRSPLENEYSDYYLLRWQILRAPWKQKKGSEKDDLEEDAIHRIAILNNKIIACARLHFINKTTAQIRYMAVTKKHQNQGVGKLILHSLEKEAMANSVQKILLHAREPSVSFYKNNQYKIIAESHTLYEKIKHFKMEREIKII